jgi:hypothetical protein
MVHFIEMSIKQEFLNHNQDNVEDNEVTIVEVIPDDDIIINLEESASVDNSSQLEVEHLDDAQQEETPVEVEPYFLTQPIPPTPETPLRRTARIRTRMPTNRYLAPRDTGKSPVVANNESDNNDEPDVKRVRLSPPRFAHVMGETSQPQVVPVFRPQPMRSAIPTCEAEIATIHTVLEEVMEQNKELQDEIIETRMAVGETRRTADEARETANRTQQQLTELERQLRNINSSAPAP